MFNCGCGCILKEPRTVSIDLPPPIREKSEASLPFSFKELDEGARPPDDGQEQQRERERQEQAAEQSRLEEEQRQRQRELDEARREEQEAEQSRLEEEQRQRELDEARREEQAAEQSRLEEERRQLELEEARREEQAAEQLRLEEERRQRQREQLDETGKEEARRREAERLAREQERKALVGKFLRKHGYRSVARPKRWMGKTKYPIHSAAKLGDPKIIDALIEEGANPAQKNSAGKTALQVAREKNKKGSHADAVRALNPDF